MNTAKLLLALLVGTVSVAELATSATVSGPQQCQTATLADYEALTDGCIIGPANLPTFTFENFGFSVLSASGSALKGPLAVVGPADIEITPSYDELKGSLGLSFSSLGFNAGSGQSFEYSISYTVTVDPPPPEIIHFSLSLADPPDDTGLAQITRDLCLYAAFTESGCPRLQLA